MKAVEPRFTRADIPRMTTKEKCLAIAAGSGWKVEYFWPITDLREDQSKPCHQVYRPDGSPITLTPDWLSDLNLMQQAEDSIRTDELWRAYMRNLYSVVGHNGDRMVRASAAQKADAFLMTVLPAQ